MSTSLNTMKVWQVHLRGLKTAYRGSEKLPDEYRDLFVLASAPTEEAAFDVSEEYVRKSRHWLKMERLVAYEVTLPMGLPWKFGQHLP